MSANSTASPPENSPYDKDVAELYRQERERREALDCESERLKRALDEALQRPAAPDAPAAEVERLRAELDEAHRQNLVYAADLAKSFGGARAQSRALVKTQEQLNRSQKLATLGQMVAAIAHDVNNMIGPIDAYSELLLRSPNIPENARKYAARIQQAASKSMALLRSLTSFGSNRVLKREAVKMDKIVHAVVALLEQNMHQKRVNIVLEIDPDLPCVDADEGQLEQVLINLMVNAQHAMEPAGGEVKIEVKSVDSAIRLSVTDQGHGIPAEVREQLFEPFFTTKEPGKGTGLGLFICHDIIERHGGTLDVHSALGVGTTFTVVLPPVDQLVQNGPALMSA